MHENLSITESGDPRDRITNQLPLPPKTAPERAYDYHRDPTLALTSTRARLLINKTPAHCKWNMDNPDVGGSDAMTMGTAVHQILLRDDRVAVLDYDSYRTAEAKVAKADAIGAGRVPILKDKWMEAREIAERVNGQILAHHAKPTPFTQGTAEHVIRFTLNEGMVECRAMLDWLRDDRLWIDDLKTTTDASPAKFTRHVFNMGYDIQAAFYTRAAHAAYGVEPSYRWVVVETNPPYPVVIYHLSDRAMASAQVKVDAAISIWNECLKTGEWPAYTQDLVEVDIPGWASDEADLWADVDLTDVPF